MMTAIWRHFSLVNIIIGERHGGLNLMGPSFTASEDILYYSRIICRSSECTGACGDIESHFVPSSVTFCPFTPSSTPTPRRCGCHHHYHGIFPRRSFFGPPPQQSGEGMPTEPDPSQTSHGFVPAFAYILESFK